MHKLFYILRSAVSFARETALDRFGVVHAGKYGNDCLDSLFYPVQPAKTVYVLDYGKYSAEERAMLVFLQGLTAKNAACIYINGGGMHDAFLKSYQEKYINTGISQTRFDYSVTDPWELAGKFKECFGGKFVVFGEIDENDPSIHIAATVAGMENWLGVPAALRDEALARGFVEARDVRNIPGSYAEKQRGIFREYKNRLNRRLIVHVNPNDTNLIDMGIVNGCFHFFTHDRRNQPENFLEERALRHEVFKWADPAALMLGFWAWDDEIVFINDISRFGKTILPANYPNCTTLASFKSSETVSQPWRTDSGAPKAEAVAGKHTIAFYVTDVDNLSCANNSGGGVCAPYENILGPRRRSGDTFKMSYSISPLLRVISPFSMEYLYNNDDNYGIGRYDAYVGCTSGMSIINPCSYPRRNLETFGKMTAQTMEKSDIRVITPIDQLYHSPSFVKRAHKYFCSFAKHSSVKGGLWQVDPPKYAAGYGVVVWAEDKPWIAVRTALWGPDDSHNSVTHEWLDRIAASLNQRSGDISSIDGYSVLAIHPWSINYEDIQYLVSRLDTDKTQIVFAEELIDMVAEHVPHKYAVPKREMEN